MSIDTKTINSYDINITIKKYLIQLGILFAITGLAFLIDVIIPDISFQYPEYAGILLIIIPLIEAIRNWLKHKDDTKIVKIDTSTGIIVDE